MDIINLEPELGTKRQNNIAIIESQRSAFVGILTLFDCLFNLLRENISLLNRRKRNLARYLLIGDNNFTTLITKVEREEQNQLHHRLRNNYLVITQPLINLNEESYSESARNHPLSLLLLKTRNRKTSLKFKKVLLLDFSD